MIMFANFFKFVLEQKLFFILLGLLLLVGGIFAWHQIPVDAFPDVTNIQVMILTEAVGLAPVEVERQITFPIEIEMNGLPRVNHVRSLSKAGLSQVVVVFDDDVDVYFARQLVFERLVRAKEKLPLGVDPEIGPISTGLGEIYQYTVKTGYYCEAHPQGWSEGAGKCSKCQKVLKKAGYSLRQLRTIQDWVIAPQLRKLRGVNEVNSFGGFVKQYHVIPEPDFLLKFGISLTDISEALQNNNANVGGNYIVRGGEQLYITSKGFFRSKEDIRNVVLKSEKGTPVYLSNIAKVKEGGETRKGVVTQDGKGEAVIGMVVMLQGENSKHVVERVKKEIPHIQRMLPPGIKIVPFYDRTSLISSCIDTVSFALFQGGILLCMVLFIMLWDMRAAIIVALSLPLTAAITFLLMYFFGMTANMMSLGGLAIALGVIVDASIVVTENIVRHLSESNEEESRTKVAYRALLEVAQPIFFAIMIIVLVFVPLFMLESLEKKMFQPLATTMCFAMLGSLFSALTVIPVLACIFVRRGKHYNPTEKWILKWYEPLLKWMLHHRKFVWIFAALLFFSMFALIPSIGTEFMPTLDEGAIAINVVRLPSAALVSSKVQSLFWEKQLLKKFPEIITIVSKSGRAEISEDPMGPEQTDLFIMLKPYRKWKTGRNKAQLIDEIRKEMLRVPGTKPAFSQPIALRVNELISGVKSDLAIKIFGNDLKKLKKIAEKIAPVLSSVKGAEDIHIEQVTGFAQIEVDLKRREMARHKINANLINSMVEMAIGGKIVTYFFEGERRFAVLIRFPIQYRNSIPMIKKLLIPSPKGYNIPLFKVARVREVKTPGQISRENSQRRLVIQCNIRGRDLGSFIQEAQRKLASIENDLPKGYRMSWGGQFENQQRAMRKLSYVVPLVIFIIFLMLFSSFRSFKSAFMVLFNLPFALIGGIWAIYLLGVNISVPSVIGFIALFGIAVEDGTVLVSFFHQLREKGLSTYESVIQGAKLRARSVIATSLTTLMGILPMLYTIGPGSEIQRPLATVMIGGLLSALLLVLIIFPAIYLSLGKTEKTR